MIKQEAADLINYLKQKIVSTNKNLQSTNALQAFKVWQLPPVSFL